MITIGLTGGIAMGKSEVAKILMAEGIPVFDADSEVHQFYASQAGAIAISAIVPEAVTAGTVDRQRLSRLVLANPALLGSIEKIVHAEIRNRRKTFLADQEAAGKALAAVDLPLLFETGAEAEFDTTIVVSARPELQRARALRRPGMTGEKLEMILGRQVPDAEKRRRARHVIESNGTLEELRARVLAVIRQIKKEHAL